MLIVDTVQFFHELRAQYFVDFAYISTVSFLFIGGMVFFSENKISVGKFGENVFYVSDMGRKNILKALYVWKKFVEKIMSHVFFAAPRARCE